jgi:alpha-beta hydrolase superfamily lysophospholipase
MKNILVFAVLFLSGIPAFGQSTSTAKVSLTTADGWKLAADWTPPVKGKAAVLLMHGLGSTRAEWGSLCSAIEKDGLGCLAIDMRGHGDSNMTPDRKDSPSRKIRWEEMPRDGWSAAALDVKAGVAFLAKKKVKKYILAGASVGANVCLLSISDKYARPVALLLLSPGEDFGGIDAFAPAGKIKVPLLVAASPADPGSYPAAVKIAQLAGAGFMSAPQGHGVNMFDGEANEKAGVLPAVAAWLEKLPLK